MNDEFKLFINKKKIAKEKIDTSLILNENELQFNLECPVCLEISYDNLICSECLAIYCFDCLNPLKKCPSCCNKDFNKVGTDHFPILLVFQSMMIKCKNHNCNKIGNLIEMEYHKDNCIYETIKCRDQCGKSIELCNIYKHYINDCELNKFQCVWCNSTFFYSEYIVHLKNCSTNKEMCVNCTGYHNNNENCYMYVEICNLCKIPDIKLFLENKTHICQNQEEIDELSILTYFEKLFSYLNSNLLSNYNERELLYKLNFDTFINIKNKIINFHDEIENTLNNELKHIKINENNLIINYKNKMCDTIELLSKELRNINIQINEIMNNIEKYTEECRNNFKITNLLYNSEVFNLENKIYINDSISHFSSKLSESNVNENNSINSKLITSNLDINNLICNNFGDRGKYQNIEVEFKRNNKLVLKDTFISFMNDNNKETRILNSQKILCECNSLSLGKQKLCKCCKIIYCIECKSGYNSNQKESCGCQDPVDICFDCSIHKCSSCNSSICGNCYYKCFSNSCFNIYCERCICLNKIQISAKHKSCNFNPCKDCSNPIECIFKSIKCKCGKRVCTICYISSHDEHSNFDFRNKKYQNI